MTLISHRLSLVKPSPTLAVNQRAQELQRQGIDIISMGAGEPDFDTPNNIKSAAIKAIEKGETKYTNVTGTQGLKNAIINKLKRENNLEYQENEIIVSNGGKQVIYNLFMSSLNEGDEVIIPAPFWVSYPDIVILAGGNPVFAVSSMQDSFKITPQILRSVITKRSKWLILNSPNNPSGAAYTKEELEDIANIVREFPNLYVMTDDIYEHITFDNFKFYSFATIAKDIIDRIFIVNGVSKTYSMTGWRIGYGAGNKDLIKAMSVIQSQSTSNPCSISQAAAIEALNGTQDFIEKNRKGFEEKRDLALSILNSSKGIECYKPEGAFYLLPSCSSLIGKKTPSGDIIKNDTDFAHYLLDDAKVAVVPGSAFGIEGYFRISYAMGIKELEEGCVRIKASCDKIHD